MKKLLAILVLGLLWSNVGFADLKKFRGVLSCLSDDNKRSFAISIDEEKNQASWESLKYTLTSSPSRFLLNQKYGEGKINIIRIDRFSGRYEDEWIVEGTAGHKSYGNCNVAKERKF